MFWRRPKTPAKSTHTTSTSKRGCPHCDAAFVHWLPIRYGPVSHEIRAQAERGELLLGGINHGRNEPIWLCQACSTRFGHARSDRDRFGRPLPPPEPPVQQRLPLRLRPRIRAAPRVLSPAA
jgi:hypothetical protein